MKPELKQALMAAIKKKEVTLSNGNRVVVRPMLVKELKLVAALVKEKELDTDKDQFDIMAKVIKSCVVEGKVNLDTMPIFDFERLYFEIHKLGRETPIINVPFICKNEVDGEECGTDIIVKSNLNTVSMSREPETLIKLNDTISVKMRYPNVTELSYFDVNDPFDSFDLAWRLVEEVHVNGNIMKVGIDIKPEEILELNEYISSEDIQKMFEFTNDMPTLVMDVAVKCPHCGQHEAYRLRGFQQIIFEN
ncbi:T4 family baseplate hub assembly chaperone [Aeromonas hydrophila]|uniref:T4 family baseplate hub assembly chaperone n=1 Tax=Aeromonas hydrophila TaxID=644 RepID=UPI000C330430|nr:hypothetical protein [Aeromonas hydrophila]PKD25058.1 T4 bacteriophage base plate protein [Aeromonas hydrophila]